MSRSTLQGCLWLLCISYSFLVTNSSEILPNVSFVHIILPYNDTSPQYVLPIINIYDNGNKSSISTSPKDVLLFSDIFKFAGVSVVRLDDIGGGIRRSGDGEFLFTNPYVPPAGSNVTLSSNVTRAGCEFQFHEPPLVGRLYNAPDGYFMARNLTLTVPARAFGVWYFQWWLHIGAYSPSLGGVIRLSQHKDVFDALGTRVYQGFPWNLCPAADQRGVAGNISWAYMYTQQHLASFLHTWSPHAGAGWMCLIRQGEAWVWTCGPENGKSTHEVGGFTNWAVGEPKSREGGYDCLLVGVDGKWSAELCNRTDVYCFQFGFTLRPSVGYFVLNVSRPPPLIPPSVQNTSTSSQSTGVITMQPEQELPFLNASSNGIVVGMFIRITTASSPADSRMICNKNTSTKGSSCCDPILFKSSLQGYKSEYDMDNVRHITWTSEKSSLFWDEIRLVGCSNVTTYNLTWWYDLGAAYQYYEPYHMYLTRSLKCDVAPVALFPPSVHQFAMQHNFSGQTCARYSDSGFFYWDCGYEGAEGSAINTPRLGVVEGLNDATSCVVLTTSGQLEAQSKCSDQMTKLCWWWSPKYLGKTLQIIVTEPTTKRDSQQDANAALIKRTDEEESLSLFGSPRDEQIATLGSLAAIGASPTAGASLQSSAAFSIVSCGSDNVNITENKKNLVFSPLHYFFGYPAPLDPRASPVVWNMILLSVIICIQSAVVIVLRVMNPSSSSWEGSCARVMFPRISILFARLMLVGTSFFTGRYFTLPGTLSSSLTSVGVLLIECFFVLMCVAGVIGWHYRRVRYPKDRLNEYTELQPKEGGSIRFLHFNIVPLGRWDLSNEEYARYSILFESWVPQGYWWPVSHTVVSAASGLLAGSSSTTSCSPLMITAGCLHIAFGMITCYKPCTRVRALSYTQGLMSLTSGIIALLKGLRVVADLSFTLCFAFVNIVGLLDCVVQGYSTWWEWRQGKSSISSNNNNKRQEVVEENEEMKTFCCANKRADEFKVDDADDDRLDTPFIDVACTMTSN
eukprot:PhF_6_TR36357/c0_g1_i2/m.53335